MKALTSCSSSQDLKHYTTTAPKIEIVKIVILKLNYKY